MIFKNAYFTWGAVLLAGLFFLLYFTVDKVIMPRVTRQSTTITVPNLIGQPFDRALATLEDVGLIFSNSTTRVAPDSSKLGVVADQHPPAQTSAKSGRRMSLAVYHNLAPPITVPDVIQKTRRSAEEILKSKDLKVRELPDPSPNPYKNTITRTYPVAGSLVSRGDSITVWYSRGPNTNRLVEVPDIVGEPYLSALAILRGLSFWPELRGLENDTDYGESSKIIRQYPGPGEFLPEGSVIRLYTRQE